MFPTLPNNLVVSKMCAAQNITGTAALTNDVDLAGCIGGVTFLVDITAIAAADSTNYVTLEIQESDDDVTYTALGSDEEYITPYNRSTSNPQPVVPFAQGTDMYGEGPLVINSTSMTGQYLIGMRPGVKRYVRIRAVETGTADLTLSVYALKHPRQMPKPGISGFTY